MFLTPSVDLFATAINTQLPVYVSWKPDTASLCVDAFSMSWSQGLLYAFQPFSRCLQKIQEDKATVLMVLPLWPLKIWSPRALQLLTSMPRLLPRSCLTLPQDTAMVHPLGSQLRMAAMLLSGDPLKTETYRRKLPVSSLHPGVSAPAGNIGIISRDGCDFVSSGRLIYFDPL